MHAVHAIMQTINFKPTWSSKNGMDRCKLDQV